YQGLLRYFTPTGELVPTPEETAEKEARKSERLAAKLRELNIDPDTI
ncbi:MAG: Uma2 family endonuclease, partial [Dolichospermum sp.]